MEAEKWCLIIIKLKEGHRISLCSKIRRRISWDWYKAHVQLKKANREIMCLANLVSDYELKKYLESQKIKI